MSERQITIAIDAMGGEGSPFKTLKGEWNFIEIEKGACKIEFELQYEFSNYILLSVPTRFIRDWITSRYLDQILQTIRNYKKEIIRIEFKIIEINEKNIITNGERAHEIDF